MKVLASYILSFSFFLSAASSTWAAELDYSIGRPASEIENTESEIEAELDSLGYLKYSDAKSTAPSSGLGQHLSEVAVQMGVVAASCTASGAIVVVNGVLDSVPMVSIGGGMLAALLDSHEGYDLLENKEFLPGMTGVFSVLIDLVAMTGDILPDGKINDELGYYEESYKRAFQYVRMNYASTASTARNLFHKEALCRIASRRVKVAVSSIVGQTADNGSKK